MPREPRKFEVGGIYHILNRGYEKRQIFLDDKDYLRFIETLYYFNSQNTLKIGNLRIEERLQYSTGQTRRMIIPCQEQRRHPLVELLAFSLMPNHYHFIIRETTEKGTSLFMQKIGNSYTGYFNTKYNRIGTGGIFQSRYKAVPVESDQQLNNVFVYVHTNPVELIEPGWKDLKVKSPKHAIHWLKDYKWSSVNDYIGKPRFSLIIQPDFFIGLYGGFEDCRKAVNEWIMFKAENTILGSEIIE